jgi:hypothetical protein
MHAEKLADLGQGESQDVAEGNEFAVARVDFAGVERKHAHKLAEIEIGGDAAVFYRELAAYRRRGVFSEIPAREAQCGVINPSGCGGVIPAREPAAGAGEHLVGDGFCGEFVAEKTEDDLKGGLLMPPRETQKIVRRIGGPARHQAGGERENRGVHNKTGRLLGNKKRRPEGRRPGETIT